MLAVGVLVAVAATISDPPAAAAVPVPTSSPAAGDPAGELPSLRALVEPGLRLVEQQAAVTANGVYRAVVDVGSADDDAELLVNLHDRVAGRARFEATLSGEQLGSTLATQVPTALSELPRDDNGSVIVLIDLNDGTLPDEPGQVTLRREGVHPVHVELRSPEGEVLDRLVTHLLRLPDPGQVEPLDVGLVLEVDAPPGRRPDGSVGFTRTTRNRLVTLVDALQRHPETELTLDVVPETLQSLGVSSDPTDRDLAARLRSQPPERVVLDSPYVDVDPAGLEAAGLGGVRDALDLLGHQTLTELTGHPPRRRTLVSAAPSAAELRLAASRGVREVVLAGGSVVEPLGAAAPTHLSPVELIVPGVAHRLEAVVVDSALRRRFARTGDPVLAAEHLLAELALIALGPSRDGDGLALVPPDDWVPAPAFLNRLLHGLDANPVLDDVTVDDLFDDDAATDLDGVPVTRHVVARLPVRPDGDLSALAEATELLEAYGSMVVDDVGRARHDELARRLPPSFSAALARDDRDRYWQVLAAEVRRQLDVLSAPPSQTFTLTADEDELPLRFGNAGDVPLRVRIEVASDKLTADDDGLLLLEAGSVVDHPVAIEVKAAGTFPVDVRLRSADGQIVVAEDRVSLRSAVLSGVGIVVSIGAAAILGAWWLLDHRRRRRPTTR